MATTLPQLHLARAAITRTTKLHNLSTTPNNDILRCRTPAPLLRAIGLPNLRISATLHKNSSQQQSEPEEKNGWPMLVGAASGALGLSAAWPAQALIPEPIEEMMRFSPEAWVNIYITTAVILPLYFVVIPLVTYNYLRLRWYNRSTLETYFQFMLVFVFFPGMLLLAPFINFRRLPPNGAQEPWE